LLLVSLRIKAASKHVGEIDPRVFDEERKKERESEEEKREYIALSNILRKRRGIYVYQRTPLRPRSGQRSLGRDMDLLCHTFFSRLSIASNATRSFMHTQTAWWRL